MTEEQVHKIKLGQFFTKKNIWLQPQIIKFIKDSKAKVVVDPFAGNGDLLKAVKNIGITQLRGYDIDPLMGWTDNDSLINIPKITNSIIVTNPPYLAKYSAKRKKIHERVNKYFNNSSFQDLYQIALQRCLVNDFVVAIIPETFINSRFSKDRLRSITILEENPFTDTDCPVCVACFGKRDINPLPIKIYKNKKYVGIFGKILSLKLRPRKLIRVRFNVRNGNVALRAVDLPNINKPIQFLLRENLNYNLDNIKYSSRLITIIDVPELPEDKYIAFIEKSNKILNQYRDKTEDILLSPFKGNNKLGIRRRRLDYATARAIIEIAFEKTIGIKNQNLSMF